MKVNGMPREVRRALHAFMCEDASKITVHDVHVLYDWFGLVICGCCNREAVN